MDWVLDGCMFSTSWVIAMDRHAIAALCSAVPNWLLWYDGGVVERCSPGGFG